jgi:hypothetical protein
MEFSHCWVYNLCSIGPSVAVGYQRRLSIHGLAFERGFRQYPKLGQCSSTVSARANPRESDF